MLTFVVFAVSALLFANRYDDEKSKRRDGRHLKKLRHRVRHPIEPGTRRHADQDEVVNAFRFAVKEYSPDVVLVLMLIAATLGPVLTQYVAPYMLDHSPAKKALNA